MVYGQTGSGKTYTMFDNENPVIVQSFSRYFSRIKFRLYNFMEYGTGPSWGYVWFIWRAERMEKLED